MVDQVNNMPGGWPLGLENMNLRLRGTEALQAGTASSSFHVRSNSFSSYSSTELDTESTRSFFRDRSITLGRLIGINPGDGDLYFTNSILSDELEGVPMVSVSSSNATERQETAISCGICIPLIVNVLVKISPSRITSR